MQIQAVSNFNDDEKVQLEKKILYKATDLIDQKLKEFKPYPPVIPTPLGNEESKADKKGLDNPQIISNYD